MKSRARVKNFYHTSVINGGVAINGYYTGEVETNYGSTHVTLPSLPTAFARLACTGRLFTSFKLNGNFNGVVTNGYLRQVAPWAKKSPSPWLEGPYNYRRAGPLQLGPTNRWLLEGLPLLHHQYRFHNGASTILCAPSSEGISFGMYPMFLKMGFGVPPILAFYRKFVADSRSTATT